MNVRVSHERRRGCGFRKPGGLYLMADGPNRPCGRLPVPLDVCPTCGGGVKPTRGWTWVDADRFLSHKGCTFGPEDCGRCLFADSVGRAGLLWIGGAFYPTPDDWSREAAEMGVSRRIPAVPKGFEVGRMWVLVAHREAIPQADCTCGKATSSEPEGEHLDGCRWSPGRAAIFRAFVPTRIEYVVKGDETEEELARLVERGIEPVSVIRIGEESTPDTQELDEETLPEEGAL